MCATTFVLAEKNPLVSELQWLLSVLWAVNHLQNIDDDIPKDTDLLGWNEGAPQRKRWLWKTAHLGGLEIPASAKCGQLQQ